MGAVLTQLATFFRDWWNKKEEGRFTALTLALVLEEYATECTGPYFDLSNYVSSRAGFAGDWPSLSSVLHARRTISGTSKRQRDHVFDLGAR